jgi:hypothetical protein
VRDREKTEALVESYKLSFKVACADGPAISAVTGAVVNDDPVYLQATGLFLNTEGRIVTAVYSASRSGPLPQIFLPSAEEQRAN